MSPRLPPWPTEAIVSVTNRCDARCTMCSIWRLERDELLTAEDYRRGLPAGLRQVNLTGGEALLRPDIVEVAHAIHEAAGHPRMILATNGFRTARTLETVAQIRRHVPALGIAVSIDGDEPTHDRMRGVPGAWRRAVATLRGLREHGMQDIRIGFTATPGNIDQLLQVYRLARELGVEFTATLAQNSTVYYATEGNSPVEPETVARHFGALVRERLRSSAPKDWMRAYFDQGVIHFARTGARLAPCDAATGFFYLSPAGNVYPCLTLPRVLGNIRDATFESIWCGAQADRIREETRQCGRCWMMCTARTELRRRPVAVAGWLAREQTRMLAHSVLRPVGTQPPA